MSDLSSILFDFCKPLKRAKRWGGGIRASCPCDGHRHGDKNPSLVVWLGESRVLAKCYIGHEWESVYSALGYSDEEWRIKATDDQPAILSTYVYTDENDEPLYRVIRYVPKRFSQERWVDGKWEPKLDDVRRVLYRLSEVIAADRVFIVEGEKDVESLRSLGYVATTSAGGAQSWRAEYAELLKGKEIIILPDSDKAGREYARSVAKTLPDARVIDLGEHHDITDLIFSAGDRAPEVIESLIEGSPIDVEPAEWMPRRTADSWMFSHSEGIDLLITQISPSSRGLHAWVEMRWRGNVPNPGLVTAARYDLMGSRTVGSMVARIKDAGIDPKDPDWRHLIQAAVYDVIQDYLEGPEAVDLSTAEPSSSGFVLRPLIGDVGATSIVGAGKSGKSLLALAAACAVASGDEQWIGMKLIKPGPVFYVDWEADEGTNAQRLSALSEGTGLELPKNRLHYIKADAPLTVWAPALARRISKAEGVLVIIDSVMMARGGEASATDTIPFFLALRSLGVPSLLIDHQSREAIEKGKTGAFGSVVNDNSVRLRWIIRGSKGMVRLSNAAANNFDNLPTISLQLDHKTRGDVLSSAKWVHVDSLPPAGTLTDQILEYTRDHPAGLSPAAAAEAIGSDADTVRRIYHRLAERELVQNIGGEWFPADEYLG